MRDGRIVAVGADVAVPGGAQRIDATGKVVTPGLINGATIVGLQEIGAVGTTPRERRTRTRPDRGGIPAVGGNQTRDRC